MQRTSRMLILLLATWFIPLGNAKANSDLVTDKLGKKIENLLLDDLSGKPVALNAIKGEKATVIVFLSFECPVSNSYATALAELHRQYAGQQVAFIAVSVAGEADEIKKQAAEFKIPFPIYIDPKANAIDALKATTTPEVFVLDHHSVLRYRGRIDDAWSARLKRNSQVGESDLKNALDDLLANRDVKVPATKPIGCLAAPKWSAAKNTTTTITYYKDVEPILQQHCQECHRPNAVGPFALMTYKQAVNWAEDIKSYTEARKMPPWKPAAGPAFHNDRRLSNEMIKTLTAWVDGGTPAGTPAEGAKPREFADGWQLGEPDLILTLPDDFTLGASGRDIFRCFVLPTNLQEDKYIIGFEVKPANKRVVHHTLNFWDTSGKARKMQQEAAQKAKPTDPDQGPGYAAAMGVGFLADRGKFGGFGGWAPGQLPRFLPKGAGYFLPKGADLVIQTHYHRDGKVEKDRLQIGLYFAKEEIDKPYQALVVSGFGLSTGSLAGLMQAIPAGDSEYRTKGDAVVNADCTIHSVMPHMHLLGKSVKVTMTPPGGAEQTLVAIDDWDYNWQETYWFKDPIAIKKGTKLSIEAIFDNSAKNPNNPRNPPRRVRFGEETTDEMLFGFLGATTDVKGQRLFARPGAHPLEEKKPGDSK